MPASASPQLGGAFDPNKNVDWKADIASSGAVSAYGPSGSLGYSAGATAAAPTGGTVTQLTNRTTGVTLNTICGTITTNTASLAAEAAAVFVVTNSLVAASDVVVVSQQSGSNGGDTQVYVSATAAGSFSIGVANNNASGGTAETGAIKINFMVLKSVTS